MPASNTQGSGRAEDKPRARSKRHTNERGFILIVVVGMLTVLVVLGLSYAEQGRVELRGASNSSDLAALDGLSEVGFQFALRALQDDRNVTHAGGSSAHLTTLGGGGWTSRWGFNPDATLGGKLPIGADRAPSRGDAYNYQDSWRLLLWNEETVEPVATWTGKAWGYGFKFRPGTDDQAKRSMETQRYPQPSTVLLDSVQLQPFARVRKFRLKVGSNNGLIQVAITPKDGGVNLNDVFDPATANERPGIYETLNSGQLEGTVGIGSSFDISGNATDLAKVPYASPDRRTLEYILGKVPQMAQKSKESIPWREYSEWVFRRGLAGSTELDNGTYNWRHYFEPYGGGRAYAWAGGVWKLWINGYSAIGGYQRASTGYMTAMTSGAPTTIWNVAGGIEPNRYGMEPSRYSMWAGLKGMAYTVDGVYKADGMGYLVAKDRYGNNEDDDYIWFPTGLWTNDPRLPAADTSVGHQYFHAADNMFHGFGFDRYNPHRAGIDAVLSDYCLRSNRWYIGAGAYGHPKARTFQLHFTSAVAKGRFWTDLLAAWYFGGAPGYTNFLGATQGTGYNNWAHLGSSYDSIGVGTHWMPPTSHVWLPGFFSKGGISDPSNFQNSWGGRIANVPGKDEVSRGMNRWPGNMPPARMAASYIVPMARWPADFVGQSNAHFTFSNFRLAIRAHGYQENWGDPVNPGTKNGTAANNRWYDAVDVNNSLFPVIYGLLSPEKFPSLLGRTTVAPHLHWKARMLDVECRLSRPYRKSGGAWVKTEYDYDSVNGATNSWMPVEVALKSPNPNDDGTLPPNAPPSKVMLPYPNGQWDGTPGDPNGLNEPGKALASRNLNDSDPNQYNPWIALRMKLQDPAKPWHPVDNPWVEPRLLRPGEAFDPLTNPMYNSQNFLDELRTQEDVRNDFIRYPWMPSLKTPFLTYNGTSYIAYGMFGYDNVDLANWLTANPGGDWVDKIENDPDPAKYFEPGGLKNFPYLPIRNYSNVIFLTDWYNPLPFDVDAADANWGPAVHLSDRWANWTGTKPVLAYPSPGWEGFLFEPRWYDARTVNPQFLKAMRDGPNGKNPWDWTEAVKDSMLKEVSDYFSKPGCNAVGDNSTLQSQNEPDNYWDFNSHAAQDQLPVPRAQQDIRRIHGGLGALSYHRYIYPDNDADAGVPDPDTANHRRNIVWGKMDFLIPEPLEYYDLNGELIGYGTGKPQDDVFVDSHYDRSMLCADNGGGQLRQQYEAMMARPDSYRNWHDWFNQRKRTIPADAGTVDKTVPNLYKPDDNDVNGTLAYDYVDPSWGPGSTPLTEGKLFENWNGSTSAGDPEYTPGPPMRRVVRGETAYWKPDIFPHSQHGIPNPDYMQNFPGYPISQHWADQFRRYFPIQLAEIDSAGDPYDDPDNNASTMDNNPYPGAMPTRFKMVDDPDLGGAAATHTAINPAIPVPRATVGDISTPVVPAVSKDEAWRITRIGPRYQEIIANEIMDYQMNPWWPNPCVPVTELCVPLDKQTYPSESRAKVKVEALTGRNRWRSYAENMTGNEGTIGCRVPRYYAYFNRFWTRTNHKAVRDWAGDSNDPSRPVGEPYRAITIKGNVAAGIPDELINATEGKGMYPPTWQYFGQYPPAEATFHDRIKDFPYNTMEDQLGDDWRYLAKAVVLMTEPQMQKAPGRNHPFRNWADFVGFLGHLVYRAPLNPQATDELAIANAKANWNPVDGVDAFEACHGPNAHPRNQGKFFDGSAIRSGAGGTVRSDSLCSPTVAKEGFWPLAANYGRAPNAGIDAMYPQLPPGGGWSVAEWKRRWDELRGRDEAGLRVEHHYISEKAANDVLVSFSNGMIGPIDFDGDGHITMTRGDGSVIQPGTPTAVGSEGANVQPSGDIPQAAVYDRWDPTYYKQYQLPAGYPWHGQSGDDAVVEYEDPTVVNPTFWHRVAGSTTLDALNLKLGVFSKPGLGSWKKADKAEIIRNCVTLPIKFRSNTFRITVVVELTDAKYEEVYASRRYQKVVSRVTDTTVANAQGPMTGEFIEHSSRAINGVDPELSWLGVR